MILTYMKTKRSILEPWWGRWVFVGVSCGGAGAGAITTQSQYLNSKFLRAKKD